MHSCPCFALLLGAGSARRGCRPCVRPCRSRRRPVCFAANSVLLLPAPRGACAQLGAGHLGIALFGAHLRRARLCGGAERGPQPVQWHHRPGDREPAPLGPVADQGFSEAQRVHGCLPEPAAGEAVRARGPCCPRRSLRQVEEKPQEVHAQGRPRPSARIGHARGLGPMITAPGTPGLSFPSLSQGRLDLAQLAEAATCYVQLREEPQDPCLARPSAQRVDDTPVHRQGR
mmetsp:Transcript_65740/g.207663  ORF Transcript_65740/g.207663 Transcript_65740/m.207663 type:complete len:230 (-) Transcript_65740:70-759(-)